MNCACLRMSCRYVGFARARAIPGNLAAALHGKGPPMNKDARRRWWLAGCLSCFGVAAAFAPLGCGVLPGGCADARGKAACDDGVYGSGGIGGAAGSANMAGRAGAAGRAGTGGGAGTGGSGGNVPEGGGVVCGGIAGLPCPDPSAMFCDYPAACGGDMTGICMPRPTQCAKDCPGACGCDGQSYCNVCEANRAGSDGEMGSCPDSGKR
jgi:hypothetical protein